MAALNASDFDRKAAAVFGLTAADHLALIAITTAVAAELRAIDLEMKTYANKRAAYDVLLEPAVLKQFETRRQDAVTRGIARLQQTLSPSVWSATRTYLNGSFRNGVRVK